MDPITTVGAGLAVIGSKDLLIKILGPTADYVGGEILGVVEKCNINLDNIFKTAESKLGDRLEQEGAVSPRVLKHILDEGRFCEDAVTAEYYGGVLAASKSDIINDDRGVSFLKQLESMSSFQIRLHYIFYFCLKKEFQGSEFNLGVADDCSKLDLYFPFELLHKAMGVEENIDGWNIITHAVTGLYKLGLIGVYSYGEMEAIKKHYKNATKAGFIIKPVLSGSELFLWGSGFHGYSGHELFKVEDDLAIESLPINDIYTKTQC